MSNDAKIINDPDDVRTPDAPPSPVSPHLESTPNRQRGDKTAVPSADALALVGWTGLAFTLTLINVGAGYVVKLPPYPSVGAHVLALVYLGAVLLALMQAARAASRLRYSTGFLLSVAALLAIPLLFDLFQIAPVPIPFSLVAKNFLGIIAASMAGAAIGRIISHPNTLLVAAGFASFFDIIIVRWGPVAQLALTNSRLIAAVSVGAGSGVREVPTNPMHLAPEPLSGVTIGPADVLFMAFFLAAVRAMNLSRRATFAWMYLLLFSALVVVEMGRLPTWLPGIPALVPMGIAVIIANKRHGAFTQQEKRDLKIGFVFAIFCALLIVFGARALIKPSPVAPTEPRFGFQLGPIGPQSSLYVGSIEPKSVAEVAGIRPGDEIISLNGTPTKKLGEGRLAATIARGHRDGLKVLFRHKDEVKVHTAVLHLKAIASPSPQVSGSPTP